MSVFAAGSSERRAVAGAFADVLSYPHWCPVAYARACAEAVSADDAEAQVMLVAFAAFAETAPLGELQEAYTRTFDLDTMSRSEPTCYPYVGHYLFDESHKRGAFILELRKRFRALGFEDESGDLSDHLVVLLRFLAMCEDETLAEELVSDAILPALARMGITASGDGTVRQPGRDAYLGVLRALERSLSAGREDANANPIDQELEREWLRDRDSLGISRDWCGH